MTLPQSIALALLCFASNIAPRAAEAQGNYQGQGRAAGQHSCKEGVGREDCQAIYKHKYCVVGAGPAGVQMGHFLNKAGMNYAVFERGHRAGTFFNKFPVHRKLNSFNRRHARSSHPEFRMRHDGHTLLEHDEVPRFPNWTKEFWPMADTYVDYLEAFQKEQERAGKIHYCHTVVAINDVSTSTSSGNTRFELEVHAAEHCKADTAWDGMKQQSVGRIKSTHHCEVLVMADGMWKPTDVALDPQPWITGEDLAL